MGRLPCPTDSDIPDADQGNGIRLLLEYALVEEKVAQTYPQTIEPGERIEERVITFLHYTEGEEREGTSEESQRPLCD